ncbi:hypothetical protein [Teredinibacter sp. KSP-S5-2]|uniref:hypothetical protein n=1 Tax=Teredinibacter sp. KSP-S5-2 TaxID=3034506 RepID=UPI0029342639|nr:hypothetical protein [Teredinibacter sp. KSP-S5-2]WNO09964.1 hypothetical protein P5V12_02145 [Teredinibacter sp. KSP-S5-2]
MNKKTPIYFGPPLVKHTENEPNTLLKSGRINRTAERYMALIEKHGLELTEAEQTCLKEVCQIGFMSPDDIQKMAVDVRIGNFSIPNLDTDKLAQKLEKAPFADLVATVEKLGF